MKKSSTRIYIVMQDGTTRLVKALNQAQALRRVARETMSCRPAHSLEVVEHMTAGVTVLDATTDTAHQGQEVET